MKATSIVSIETFKSPDGTQLIRKLIEVPIEESKEKASVLRLDDPENGIPLVFETGRHTLPEGYGPAIVFQGGTFSPCFAKGETD